MKLETLELDYANTNLSVKITMADDTIATGTMHRVGYSRRHRKINIVECSNENLRVNWESIIVKPNGDIIPKNSYRTAVWKLIQINRDI